MSNESDVVRSAGGRNQFHPGFIRSTVTLPVVASHACADEVLPRLFSAARLGHDMIDGEWKISATAVLTPVAVASKNILSR